MAQTDPQMKPAEEAKSLLEECIREAIEYLLSLAKKKKKALNDKEIETGPP